MKNSPYYCPGRGTNPRPPTHPYFITRLLNIAHVTNDVKWRPIVTTFGTLIENMSRTGLYDCHIFSIWFDDFMSNINCGIGVLDVKRQIFTYFCDVISLLTQVFIVSFDRAYKEVSTYKYWNFSMAQFVWYDCTFKKQCTVPVTFDLWKSMLFQCIDNDPISVLYEFQIDISTNSWEIKFQNMGLGL